MGKRITRNRRLTDEEKARYGKVRAEIAEELPEIKQLECPSNWKHLKFNQSGKPLPVYSCFCPVRVPLFGVEVGAGPWYPS